MNMFAYSVFDTKSLIYHLPFFQPTDGAAIRMLADLVNDPNTQMGRHPSDFVLFCVGTYDGNVGGLQSSLPLRHIIDASALVRVQPELPFQSFNVDPNLTNEQLKQQLANGEAK